MSLHGTRIEKMMHEDRQVPGNFRLQYSSEDEELWIMEKSKKELFPFYGYCVGWTDGRTGTKIGYIYLAKGLPLDVRNVMYDHEFHHFTHNAGGTWKSEAAAHWYSFKRNPWGYVKMWYMSLMSGRLWQYYKDLQSRK